jgi:very-short-patch-repair endonuclease
MQQYAYRLTRNARALRARATDAERFLWRHLCAKRMLGLRFYRQRPLLDYVLDFYCPRARLVVELDGGQQMAGRGCDSRSTVEGSGARRSTVRRSFILTEVEAVLEAIRLVVVERTPL